MQQTAFAQYLSSLRVFTPTHTLPLSLNSPLRCIARNHQFANAVQEVSVRALREHDQAPRLQHHAERLRAGTTNGSGLDVRVKPGTSAHNLRSVGACLEVMTENTPQETRSAQTDCGH